MKKIFAKNLSVLGGELLAGNITTPTAGKITTFDVGNITSVNRDVCGKSRVGNITKRVQVAAIEMRRVEKSFEEVMEMKMSPAQKEVFIVIDEWWKKFGYSPTIRDIAFVRGKMGLGCTHKIVDRLVKLGALKKVKGQGRSIRPVYINFRTLE